MTSKLFGQENAETKESKANLISDQITDAEDSVERAKQNIL